MKVTLISEEIMEAIADYVERNYNMKVVEITLMSKPQGKGKAKFKAECEVENK